MDGVDYIGVVGFVCGVGGNSCFGCDSRVCGVACDEGIGDEEDIGSIDGAEALVTTVALVSRVTKICDKEDISIIDGNDVVKCMVGVDCVDCIY